MYTYKGFGLTITSEIIFPELIESKFSNQNDVSILLRNIDEKPQGSYHETSNFTYTIAENSLLFEAKGIARYLSTNGNQIFVQIMDPSVEPRTIRLYILATVMASILLQRNKIPFHASSFFFENQLVLISGNSGAGKSTLLAEFIKNGFRLFSDDINILHKKNETIVSSATYPMIKLWDNAIKQLNHPYFNDRTFKIQSQLDKFGIFYHNQFDFNEYPPGILIILKKTDKSEFSSRLLNGNEAFTVINHQIYRSFLIQSIKHRKINFELTASMVKQCKTIEISRPENCTPDKLMKFTLKEIEKIKYSSSEIN